jgi:hypothetical protein
VVNGELDEMLVELVLPTGTPWVMVCVCVVVKVLPEEMLYPIVAPRARAMIAITVMSAKVCLVCK